MINSTRGTAVCEFGNLAIMLVAVASLRSPLCAFRLFRAFASHRDPSLPFVMPLWLFVMPLWLFMALCVTSCEFV